MLERVERLPLEHPRRAIDWHRWEASLEQSIERRRLRESLRISFEIDDELPIAAHREELVRLIQDRQAIVVCGETGSGKSTQLPKFCLEAGYGRRAMIGHTQPRRLAARTISARLKSELHEAAAGVPIVGYKVRFTDATAPTTLVKLMTDGVLLAELTRDRFLDAYEVIIIDEAHERSLNIDLLMGHLHRLLPKRPELRVIITSATIDAEKFSAHFSDALGPAPIVEVSGRTYPVEIRYRGTESGGGGFEERLLHAIDELLAEQRGDILAFFPTERDIRLAHQQIRGYLTSRGLGRNIDILPLYARLTEAEQQKIFTPHKNRRIVLATNVAESSLTVPGIYSVIDSGTARIARYAARSKVQRLPIEAISQASANQRAGRCGRLGPGVCIRLYDESDYVGRPSFTTPEIRRTDLASAILQTELLKLGSLESLPLLDPPRPEMIRDGMLTLQEIQAMDAQSAITPIGRQLGRWPVSPRVGRMMVAAHHHGCLADVLIIASALEAQDVRMRPIEKQGEADAAHEKFVDPRSDFLGFLKVWDFYQRLKSELGRSRLEKACRENYLSLPRLHEWLDLHRQLVQLVQDAGWRLGERKHSSWNQETEPPREAIALDKIPGYAEIHQSLLTGLLSGIAMRHDEHEYKGPNNMELKLWPGSGLRGRKPKWIVAAEVVETHQRYARTVAAIEPEWLEMLAGHLLKRHHDSPFFSRRSGSAMIEERATLFGLPVYSKRVLPLPPIDPSLARKLLIDQGLVQGELVTRAHFVSYNRRLLDELQRWATKTRRREWMIDPYDMRRFYEQHLPDDVVDRNSLEAFDRRLRVRTDVPLAPASGTPAELEAARNALPPIYLRWESLAVSFDPQRDQQAYPDAITIGPTILPLEYHFVPGGEDDGVTVVVPRSALSQLSEDGLGWLIPGLLRDKVAHLIKTLPKPLRRNLVPAVAMADKALPKLIAKQKEGAPFWKSLATILSDLSGETIQIRDFEIEKLDPLFRFRLAITDEEGKVEETTREVPRLRAAALATSRHNLEMSVVSDSSWYRERMTSFDLDKLPRRVVIEERGLRLERSLALVDHATFVRPTLFDDPQQAEGEMMLGLVRLYALVENRELRSQVAHLPQLDQAQMRLNDRISGERLRAGLSDLLAKLAFVEDAASPDGIHWVWDRATFDERRVDRVRKISMAAAKVGTWLPALTQAYHGLRLAWPSPHPKWQDSLSDIQQQLKDLFHDRFLTITPWEWLNEFPRYLQAIHHRIQRWPSTPPDKERGLMEIVHYHWNEYRQLLSRYPQFGRTVSEPESKNHYRWPIGALANYRWMIEELRVSLFAQQLGTRSSVSGKRLDKLREACLALIE